jgi:hypothetical protein
MSLADERVRLLRAIADHLSSGLPTAGPLGSLGRVGAQLVDQMTRAPEGGSVDASSTACLDHVTQTFDLRPFERDALLLSAFAELDWQFGRLLGYAQDHPTLVRPTVGLALMISRGNASVLDLCEGPLVRDGLVILDGDGTLATRIVRTTAGVAERVFGRALDRVRVRPDPDLLARLVLQDDGARIERWAASPSQPLLLAGARGSGRETLARAAAGRVGASLLSFALRAGDDTAAIARRDSRWYDAAVLLSTNDESSIDWRAVWSSLSTVARPVIIALPSSEVERAADACATPPTIVRLGSPAPEQRRKLWRVLTPPSIADAEVDALAARFAFGPGKIARAVESARAESATSPDATALMFAARELGRTAMGNLAQRIAAPFTREDLVVTDRVHAELDLALAWLRHQKEVQIDWGLGRRIARGRGLTVLFAGEPGTGKTMAAQVLARELELDLYLIDLSRVLSKYIGETEKNLARLFDEAHDAGAMLFFDEGDALFGKRTETRDAHDRYANVEISYLLQRMEQHEGVTVLATNRLRDVDEAFVRRFHVIADFTLPEPADRLQIWTRMLAPPVACDGDLRLPIIAREFQLSGGQIRNAVLTAAHYAAADAQPIGWRHLEKSLRRELKQQGRVFDERVSRALGVVPGR